MILLLLILFSGFTAGNSVGALPGSLDIGAVEPGSTVEQNVYIRATNIGQNFTVVPSANEISASTIFSGAIEESNEVSEQKSVDWWNFEESFVNPTTELSSQEIDIENAPTIHGVTQITLDIPENAEPGYRYGNIRLNPQFTDLEQEGSGARVVTPTRIPYSFRVTGEVERNIIAQDVRGFRLGEDRAAVEVLLRNQGTVTTSTEEFEMEVFDSNRNVETTLQASGTILGPGESQWVDASWTDGNGVEEGNYQIDGEVDYFTGSAYASGSFSLPDFDVVEVRPDDSPAVDNEDERESVPLWLVVMVLVILGVLMWSFGIDPFWILVIVGFIGISAFILMSGISNMLLVVLLIVVGIVVYGGL